MKRAGARIESKRLATKVGNFSCSVVRQRRMRSYRRMLLRQSSGNVLISSLRGGSLNRFYALVDAPSELDFMTRQALNARTAKCYKEVVTQRGFH
jgi:hypothetical protein